MTIRRYGPVILLIVTAFFLVSCNRTSSELSSKSGAPENANTGQPAPVPPAPSSRPADSPPATGPAGAPKLAGAYVMTEVHDKGVVNIISELKTVIFFSADGSYTRSSSKKERIYHTDSGTYTVEGGDNLVLSIQMSNTGADRKIHTTPIKKTHKFTLSSNGEELRMISADGKVALFRRSDTLPK